MERIFIKDLLRLTLTRKGKAVAKHPLLREGVIETVKAELCSAKASQIGTMSASSSLADSEPTWLTPVNANLERYRTGHWG